MQGDSLAGNISFTAETWASWLSVPISCRQGCSILRCLQCYSESKSNFSVIASKVAQTLYCCSLQWLQIVEFFKREPCLCTEMQKKPATSASRLWGLCTSCKVRARPSEFWFTDTWMSSLLQGEVHRALCKVVDLVFCVLELHGRNTFSKQP